MTNSISLKIDRKILFSCFLAGCLEMYDFLLFGFLAPVIHANYLSFLTKGEGVMVAYLLFAVGFLFRPLGSFIFGYIGDVYGRKRAVVLSVSLMGVASLCMALLPPYSVAGGISCWVIVMIRIIQGISVGGEYSGVTIYAIEHTNKKNAGVIGSIVLAGGVLGVLLATMISKILQSATAPEYAWRVAFLLGFGLSIVGYFIRSRLSESPLFKKSDESKGLPLLDGLKSYKKEFFASMLLAGANNANFYFILIFIPGFLKTHAQNALIFSTSTLTAIMLCLLPFIGWVSDRVGRLKILILTSMCFALYQQILLPSLMDLSSEISGESHMIICAILLTTFVSTTNIFVLEIFPPSCRFSCGALSYSIGTALFGGTAPFMCSFIIENYGPNPDYLAYYISFLSCLGLLGTLLMPKTKSSNEELKQDNPILKNS